MHKPFMLLSWRYLSASLMQCNGSLSVPDGSGIGPDLKIGPFTLTVLYKERSDLHGGFEFLTIGGTRTIRRD